MLKLPSFYQRSVNFNLFFIIKLRYFVRVASALLGGTHAVGEDVPQAGASARFHPLSNRFYAREGIVVSFQAARICVANVHTLW
jgi:hypothetical protein